MRRERFTPRVRRASSVPEPGEIIVPILILRSRVLHRSEPSACEDSFTSSLRSMSSCACCKTLFIRSMGSDSRGNPDATCDEGVCSKREDMFDAMRAAGIGPGAPTTSYGRGASTGGGSCPVDVDDWDARRGPWCVRARRTRRLTDGIPLLYSFPRSYTRWRRITRYARLAPAGVGAPVGGAFDWPLTFLSFPPRAQDVPTATQRVQARRFFDALGDLYPCATCRADFRVDSRASPPRVDSARPCPDGCASATTRSTPSSENLS